MNFKLWLETKLLVPMKPGFFFMDIRKDEFIHFTSLERANNIIKTNRLMMSPGMGITKFGTQTNDAISLVYGKFHPSVQTTHMPQPLVAIQFKTHTLPRVGYIEEVKWDEDVVFTSAKVIPFQKAVDLLSNSPEKISDQDQILYST